VRVTDRFVAMRLGKAIGLGRMFAAMYRARVSETDSKAGA
jgi:hypothetical protein